MGYRRHRSPWSCPGDSVRFAHSMRKQQTARHILIERDESFSRCSPKADLPRCATLGFSDAQFAPQLTKGMWNPRWRLCDTERTSSVSAFRTAAGLPSRPDNRSRAPVTRPSSFGRYSRRSMAAEGLNLPAQALPKQNAHAHSWCVQRDQCERLPL